MTGICGIVGPDTRETSRVLEAILDGLGARGSSRRTVSRQSQGRLFVLGIREGRESNPGGLFSNGDLTLCIDGYFHGRTLKDLEESTLGFDELSKLHGAYAMIGVDSNGLRIARDPLGQKPLYETVELESKLDAFASTRTALVAAGLRDPGPFPPGRVKSIPVEGSLGIDDQRALQNFESTEDVREDDAVDRIGSLLVDSVAGSVPDKSGIAFSGGIDSSLVAKASILAERQDVRLFTVGTEGQPELAHAEEVADALGLPVIVRELTAREVVDLVPLVVEATESTDPVIVGVSLPFFAVCQMVKAEGLSHVVAGQLSDELFGGYARFEELAGDETRVSREVWRSVQMASTNDFEPGDKVAVTNGLELRCPFGYLPLVQYSLELSPALKVRVVNGKPVRKYVLRRLASHWGLPDSVVSRPKQAIQYSTGVMSVLEREARSRRLGLREFFREQVA